ncbi:hypothetical protein ACIHFD_56445 [Nonomuraea sp. NPDC051941]|uniref:hypothetical protein n=1 Tax=Nonomuraea sp. NPDC051941 TaxID=3364373 RepID=UPI0037C6BDF6
MTSDEINGVYRLGFTQGEETGYRRAEIDMEREWSAVAEKVRSTSRTPTAAELAERRKPGGPIYEAALRRRGGREYEGGPVNFWTGQPLISEESA